jgi:hypothetical protein
VLRLHTTQRHLRQGVGALDFVHGCQGQDLTGRLGVKLDAVLGNSQGSGMNLNRCPKLLDQITLAGSKTTQQRHLRQALIMQAAIQQRWQRDNP